MIRVAVDARPLSSPLSGVSRVIAMVLKYFPEPNNYCFFLYSHLPWHSDFKEIVELPHVVWIQGRGFTARKGGLWFNLTLPKIIRSSSISLFWGAQQVIPPALPKNMPVVLTFYDLVSYFFPKAMRRIARIQQGLVQSYSVKRAARILSISRQTQEDMIRKFHYPPERAAVSLLGYEGPKFSGSNVSPFGKGAASSRENTNHIPSIAAELDLKKPYILSVSTIEPRKNYSLLLDAYEEYLKRDTANPYPLVIAGRRGWETKSFYRKLEKLQNETGRISVFSNLNEEELDTLYSRCAFFCFPTLYEGFGLPLLEALGHKKYSLASDIGSLREIGGDQARYLSASDSAAWAGAILESVEAHRAGRLKKVEFSLSKWSWKGTAKVHLDAFRAVLAS